MCVYIYTYVCICIYKREREREREREMLCFHQVADGNVQDDAIDPTELERTIKASMSFVRGVY